MAELLPLLKEKTKTADKGIGKQRTRGLLLPPLEISLFLCCASSYYTKGMKLYFLSSPRLFASCSHINMYSENSCQILKMIKQSDQFLFKMIR